MSQSALEGSLGELMARLLSLGWAHRAECVVARHGEVVAHVVSADSDREPFLEEPVALYCAAKPMLAIAVMEAAIGASLAPSDGIMIGGRFRIIGEVLAHRGLADPNLVRYAAGTVGDRRQLVHEALLKGVGSASDGYSVITAPWLWASAVDLLRNESWWRGERSLWDAGILPPPRSTDPRKGHSGHRLLRDLDQAGHPLLPSEALQYRNLLLDPAFGIVFEAGQLHAFSAKLGPRIAQIEAWATAGGSLAGFRSPLRDSHAASDGTGLECGFVRGIGCRVDDALSNSWGHAARGGSIFYLYSPEYDMSISFWCDGHTQDRVLIRARVDRVVEAVIEGVQT